MSIVRKQQTQYNPAAIPELLSAAFTAKTLRRFCEDHPLFNPLVTQFGPGQGLDDMVDEVIEYCEKGLLWDELLAGVKEINPRRYDRFVAGLTKQDRANGAAPPGAVPEAAGQVGAGSIFAQQGQIVGAQINIAGDVYGPLPGVSAPDTPVPGVDVAGRSRNHGRIGRVRRNRGQRGF